MAETKPVPTPSSALEGKFEVVGIVPGKVMIDGQTVDFTTISLTKAEALYNRKGGCRYLKKMEKSAKNS
ncbi:hypothetical protein SAMN05421823_102531 [Catalinimonas alkaloidigena]|uniref:Uncharacterized protein n=1 Tax=Catalinimonas alkaloidigena TaxID=1075417 RepID=A0A1G9B863_9BACT|nr:hypothetical protein [Catalinimonas alkaloidigena]SDK35210.1 hypothetical protein SAMN05421823_102531 [Catalinimonas alkaloidigena]